MKLLLFSLLALLPTVAHAERRALLVGVGDYPQPEYRLAAPAGDVERIAGLLKTHFGFSDREIVKLLDRQATTSGVKAAFRKELIDGTKPGDVAVFYFTGHGGVVADLDGDEEDGLDEALCTYDIDGMKPETWLIDDDLRRLLTQMPGRQILVILDCCHSGTGTRGLHPPPLNPKLRPKFMPLGFLAAKEIAARPKSTNIDTVELASNHLLLAACDAHEEAFEVEDAAGRRTSVFTASLVQALEKGPGAKTFRGLATEVSALVKKTVQEAGGPAKVQTPQFEGARLGTTLVAYFTEHPAAPAPPVPAARLSGGEPRMPSELEASGEIKVALSVNRQVCKTGEKMVVTVRAGQACHLRLYDFNARHEVTQIFPNQYQRDNALRAGEAVTLPGIGAPFEFEMGPPYGAGVLVAVASDREFTDRESEDFSKGLFHSLGAVPIADLVRRGINVKPAQPVPLRVGKAYLVYRVDEGP